VKVGKWEGRSGKVGPKLANRKAKLITVIRGDVGIYSPWRLRVLLILARGRFRCGR